MKLSLAFVFLVAALTIQVIGKNVDGVKTVSKVSSSPKKTNGNIVGGRKMNSTNVKNPEKNTTKRNKSQKKAVSIAMKIVKGRNVAQKKFPWMVKLKIAIKDDLGVIKHGSCGGTLIDPYWVLTAAHCFEGAFQVNASVGGVYAEVNNEKNEEMLTSTAIHMHSSYNKTTQANDIALIKFETGFSINEFINIMRLPRASDAEHNFVSKKVVAMGYGRTSGDGPSSPNLLRVDLNVASNKICADVFNSKTFKIMDSNICTEGNRDKTICKGDSGGPLVYKEEDGIYTQIGITSAVAQGCISRYPAIFTRVTSYLEWIVKYTKVNIVP